MHFPNFEVFWLYRISRIFCRRCFDYKIVMIIILRLKRELCPGGFQQTHRCIRKIQLKLFPIIFFSFHPNVQTICSSFIKIDNTCTTWCVDINVYFILKDSFIHSFIVHSRNGILIYFLSVQFNNTRSLL